jgi:hypothetical protein
MTSAPTSQATGRLNAATALAIAGALSLFAALMVHEILTFGGTGHGLINADRTVCPDIACPTTGLLLTAHIAKAIGAAFLFSVIGAIWVDGLARSLIAAAAFVGQYLLSLVGLASGYRAQFGTTWAWWEPFAELLWSPILTPALLIVGLTLTLGIDRQMRRAG